VTLRPIFIVLGSILMVGTFILMFTSREVARQLDHSANERPAVDAAMALQREVGTLAATLA